MMFDIPSYSDTKQAVPTLTFTAVDMMMCYVLLFSYPLAFLSIHVAYDRFMLDTAHRAKQA